MYVNINGDYNEDRIIFFRAAMISQLSVFASFMSDRSARTSGAHAMFSRRRPCFY